MPSSYPSGRFSLIALRTALSAARRSAGRAARYWATVEAVMLGTIPAELCGGQAPCPANIRRPFVAIRESRIASSFLQWLSGHDLITRGISVLLLSRSRVACERGVSARIFPKARQL